MLGFCEIAVCYHNSAAWEWGLGHPSPMADEHSFWPCPLFFHGSMLCCCGRMGQRCLVCLQCFPGSGRNCFCPSLPRESGQFLPIFLLLYSEQICLIQPSYLRSPDTERPNIQSMIEANKKWLESVKRDASMYPWRASLLSLREGHKTLSQQGSGEGRWEALGVS